MGEVYRARDTRLDRDVAIKVLSAALAARSRRARAIRARSAAASPALASQHPGDLRVRHDAGTAFVVTELVDGETLRARLANGPLPPRRAVAYAQQIARGIAAAHARGHRPSRPQARERDDHARRPRQDSRLRPRQADRPVERRPRRDARRDGRPSAGTVLGTFGYMAPEQVRGLAVDHRADIFALRRGALRDAQRRARLQGRDGRRHDDGDPHEGSARPRRRSAATSRPASTASSAAVWRRRPNCASSRRTISRSRSRRSRRHPSASGVDGCGRARLQESARVAMSCRGRSRGSRSLAAAACGIEAGAAPPRRTWQHFMPVTEAAGEETSPAIVA